MTIPVLNFARLTPEIFADIETELSTQHVLKDVIAWALSKPGSGFIPAVVKDVVVQDEFTHDVIVPWGEELTLVYDTT